MLRDITLGQYYPADSVVHKLDPRVKLFATLVYIIALFTFRGILGLALITGMLIFMIKISKVPFKFIVNCSITFDHCSVQSAFYTEWNAVMALGTILYYQHRYHECGTYDNPTHLSDHWHLTYDTDNNTEPVDGWFGKSAWRTQPDSYSGTCNCHDDVHCASFYSNFNRRNRQDHESTDGKRCRF